MKYLYEHHSGSIVLGNLVIAETVVYDDRKEFTYAWRFENRIEFDKWLEFKNISSSNIVWQ